MEKVSFLSKGQTIRGTIIKPRILKDKNPGVIFFHGMTSSEKGYIPIGQFLAQNGIVSLTLSFRGHGESDGDFETLTVRDAMQDGLAAYDFLARFDYVDRGRVGLCGTSLGAAVSSYVSSLRDVKSMVLRVPALYSVEKIGMTYRSIMNAESTIFKELDIIKDTPHIKAIKRYKGALCVIPSEFDSVIPKSISNAYYQYSSSTVKKIYEIKGAQHGLSGEAREQFVNEVVGWFPRTL